MSRMIMIVFTAFSAITSLSYAQIKIPDYETLSNGPMRMIPFPGTQNALMLVPVDPDTIKKYKFGNF